MDSYKSEPETTFIGAEVSKGTAAVLARYRRAYPDQDHMGRTEFSELEARPLSDDLAIVTGRYRLERSEEWRPGPRHLFARDAQERRPLAHHSARLT